MKRDIVMYASGNRKEKKTALYGKKGAVEVRDRMTFF